MGASWQDKRNVIFGSVTAGNGYIQTTIPRGYYFLLWRNDATTLTTNELYKFCRDPKTWWYQKGSPWDGTYQGTAISANLPIYIQYNKTGLRITAENANTNGKANEGINYEYIAWEEETG